MKTLLLVRHAERPTIPADEVGNEVLLTEKGEKDTLLFASQIAGPIVSIKSSSIPRCVQTAELIARQAMFPLAVVHSRLLGDPGFIIEDGGQAWKHWQEKGHQRVNQHLLAGDKHWSGFAPLDQATQEMTQVIERSLRNASEGVHVWVTHDTVLAAYASRVLPERLCLEEWPDFLGHLRIELHGQGLIYRYYKRASH
ncbi:MAG: phosphoglycerate mutase family protein [Gammaproteobacteria bacterium]|nr:phosphoglycerate mutase family protein [Gammaproteobacteria bacterium]